MRKQASAADARQHILALTSKGRKTFAPLNQRSQDEVAEMLARIAPPGRARLLPEGDARRIEP